MADITIDLVTGLYREYRGDLEQVRQEQRRLRLTAPSMKAQLDDIEAEITYLLLRHTRPETVVEIGAYHGWSTTWILRALRDNGQGHLHSVDLIAASRRHVPSELTSRWSLTQGNARAVGGELLRRADYLFIDADHGRRFARWYLVHLLPELRAGVPVSVHDVFHRRRAKPFSEGSVVLRWLDEQRIPFFTAARRRAPRVQRELSAVKDALGLGEPVRVSPANPMIFFRMA
ncbi:MAG: class I SAM-dependent methyltransferase [Pseudonocardiaceae bacterium]